MHAAMQATPQHRWQILHLRQSAARGMSYTTIKPWHLQRSTLFTEARWPLGPSAVMRSILTPATHAQLGRSQSRCLHASLCPAVKPAVALDVEFVHMRHAAVNTWTIVPGEVALVTADGILMHTYIHPGQALSKGCQSQGGVHKKHWHKAPILDEIAERVRTAVEGRVLVGHGLMKDLTALGITHPTQLQVDTALLPPFLSRGGQARRLQALSSELLGSTIQSAGRQHSALEDASAVLQLYIRFVEGNSALMDAAALEMHLLNQILCHHERINRLDE